MLRPGVVVITLLGERIELVPTLRAGDRLNRAHSGFRGVIEGLARLDLDVMTDVVLAGANLSDEKRVEVRKGLFALGLPDASLALGRFVANLANGGRPPVEEGDAPGKDEAARASPGTPSPPTSSASEPDGSGGTPTSSVTPTSPTS